MSDQDGSAQAAAASGPPPRLKHAMGRIEQGLRERGSAARGTGRGERPPGVEALDAATARASCIAI